MIRWLELLSIPHTWENKGKTLRSLLRVSGYGTSQSNVYGACVQRRVPEGSMCVCTVCTVNAPQGSCLHFCSVHVQCAQFTSRSGLMVTKLCPPPPQFRGQAIHRSVFAPWFERFVKKQVRLEDIYCLYPMDWRLVQGILTLWSMGYVCYSKIRLSPTSKKLSVESQKGIIALQICSIENQKRAIAVQSIWR